MATARVEAKRGRRPGRARLADIAARCEVSLATVSRALAGGPVRPELSERIRRVARELDYPLRAPEAGRRVVVAASSAAMLDFARDQFTLHVLDGIRGRAAALEIELDLRPVASPEESGRLLAEAGRAPEVGGVLFLTMDDDAMLARSRGFAKPLVLVNGDDPDMRLSSVAPCNRSAAALATGHLQRLGHRRILFLTRPGRRTIARRLEGWRDRMGADYAPGLVVEVGDWLAELAAAAVAARLARGRDFTAIVAAGDALAAGALRALAEAGVAVPSEVSVIGIDGLPQGALTRPPLTSVEIPMRAVGAVALDVLRAMLAGDDLPPRRIELACRLIERGSCGPA